MNAPTDNEQRLTQAFRRFGLPIMGVLETIATQGKSPGTTALRSEQIFQQQEDRARQAQREMEADALRRRVGESQLDKAKREKEMYETETARREEWEAGVDQIPETEISGIERLALKSAGPERGIQYLVQKGKPDIAQMMLAMRLGSQENIAGQRIQSQKDIAGMNIQARKEIAQIMADIKKEAATEKKAEKQEKKKEQEKKNHALYEELKMLGNEVPAGGRIFGAGSSLAGKVGLKPEVEVYNRAATAFVSVLSRQYGGEKGVLTDYDVSRMKGMMFKPTDTEKERAIKIGFWDDLVYGIDDGSRLKKVVSKYWDQPTKVNIGQQPAGGGETATGYLEEIRARRAQRGQK